MLLAPGDLSRIALHCQMPGDTRARAADEVRAGLSTVLS